MSKPESEADKAGSDVAGVALSPDLERELCLAVNRELHVSYCYLVMGGIFTRQGLKSFSGMCERQVMMMIMMMMMQSDHAEDRDTHEERSRQEVEN